ncbi:hypothetical protein DCS32_01810 [Dokdonia sp. Dokd-P16]|uniref:hypothetical protein n=1 Tax=Dokdonia sp. Dokd-P16 TaxID=2173169 RepID=UPI000D54923E|nr:hypothetical protein [Dokdonia sp. Dokd-P16]AWH72941.1 hypothetical protein DCS32_01810 [Dokdonia sp. Dokd-P16]
MKKGIRVDDNIGRFSFEVPNEDWAPYFHKDYLGNGVTVGLVDGDNFKTFSVIELTKAENWLSKENTQTDIEANFNIIESGRIVVNGQESLWNLADFNTDSVQSLSLYVTVEYPTENWFYTLNLSVSTDEYGKKDLCELENLILSFRTN